MTKTAINLELKRINDKLKHLESSVEDATQTGSLVMLEMTDRVRKEILREFSILQDERDNAVAALKKQPKLSIPKKIAELADKEFNQGDDVLGFGFSTTEFGFANEELRCWVTNYGEYDEVATERANILSAYLAGKALGVELVDIEED